MSDYNVSENKLNNETGVDTFVGDEIVADDKSGEATTIAIRELNDKFRNGDLAVPGRWLFTAGVNALLENLAVIPEKLMATVRDFDNFDADNDPYHEHDFGAFEFLENKLFWKIDYYSHDPNYGSDDPSDIAKTLRVMTIMLAQEY